MIEDVVDVGRVIRIIQLVIIWMSVVRVFLMDVALVMAHRLEVRPEDQEELVYGDGEGVAPEGGWNEAELEDISQL
jgi:hypothetical protein